MVYNDSQISQKTFFASVTVANNAKLNGKTMFSLAKVIVSHHTQAAKWQKTTKSIQ